VSEDFDAAVRFGEIIAKDMIAVPLGPRQRMALDGCGIAFAFESQVMELIARGKLVRVLEDWCPYRLTPGVLRMKDGHRAGNMPDSQSCEYSRSMRSPRAVTAAIPPPSCSTGMI
jgi:hypothetical protein